MTTVTVRAKTLFLFLCSLSMFVDAFGVTDVLGVVDEVVGVD